VWSRRDSMLRRARMPRRFRARVEWVVDAPLTPEHVTATTLEARVRELRGELA
jgi:stringent starvation protein B